ncbi:MAG: tetratricopeptide repeat protein [Phycisphaerales bacterium]
MHPRHLTAAVLIALAALPLSACKSQQEVRALPMVRESASRAYTYGNYDLAVTEYREVVMRKPGYWQDRMEYAKSLLAANRPGEAREQMEILYTSKPNRFDVLDLLAKSMVASRDVEGMARVMKDEAYARNTARDWVRYGWYMSVAGDADEGEWALKRGAELDRGRNAGPQLALAELYRSSGDKPNAIMRYRMAQAIEPYNEEVREALITLGEDPNPANAIVPAEASLPPTGRAADKRPTASVSVPDR